MTAFAPETPEELYTLEVRMLAQRFANLIAVPEDFFQGVSVARSSIDLQRHASVFERPSRAVLKLEAYTRLYAFALPEYSNGFRQTAARLIAWIEGQGLVIPECLHPPLQSILGLMYAERIQVMPSRLYEAFHAPLFEQMDTCYVPLFVAQQYVLGKEWRNLYVLKIDERLAD